VSEPSRVERFHRELADVFYRSASEHEVTGCEAIGVLFLIASEFHVVSMVSDGLLQAGPSFSEEPAKE
jgi:hypothetical protein